MVDDRRIAVEVELAPKSKQRLDAILRLHRDWFRGKKTNGIVYICANEEGRRRIQRAHERVDVTPGYRLRIELLGTIKEQTRAAFERARSAGLAAALGRLGRRYLPARDDPLRRQPGHATRGRPPDLA